MKKKRRISNIIKLIAFLVLVVVVIKLVLNTTSRYESQTSSIGKIDVALYVLNEDTQTMNLCLDQLTPREDPYIYNFSISNFNETNRTDLNIEYTLSIKTTTNLPLIYKLYENQTYDAQGAIDIALGNNTISADSDGTYFRTITAAPEDFGYVENQTNYYQLAIYFPAANNSPDYQNIIESLEIIINSSQIVDGE
ncbi:MAG: hypothetical protein FWF46_01750 [Oscillospiraceae bacterium]|nr:hypothetical protein [Oscillospiraceae bacterium]